MPLSEYRSISAAAALFHMRHLELAPEGWRICVDRVAQGIFDKGKEKTYCVLCGGEIQGLVGHQPGCLTMVARRILANEPLLVERYKSQLALEQIAFGTPGR
jgi:hypothetical protein